MPDFEKPEVQTEQLGAMTREEIEQISPVVDSILREQAIEETDRLRGESDIDAFTSDGLAEILQGIDEFGAATPDEREAILADHKRAIRYLEVLAERLASAKSPEEMNGIAEEFPVDRLGANQAATVMSSRYKKEK